MVMPFNNGPQAPLLVDQTDNLMNEIILQILITLYQMWIILILSWFILFILVYMGIENFIPKIIRSLFWGLLYYF